MCTASSEVNCWVSALGGRAVIVPVQDDCSWEKKSARKPIYLPKAQYALTSKHQLFPIVVNK